MGAGGWAPPPPSLPPHFNHCVLYAVCNDDTVQRAANERQGEPPYASTLRGFNRKLPNDSNEKNSRSGNR